MSSFLSGLTLGSVLLGAALSLIVVLFLARPFAVRENEEERVDREEIDGLLLRKESLLRDIRELDDDFEASKVAPEMYQRTRPQLMKQAAIIMKQLDEHGYVEGTGPAAVVAADVDAQIEAAIRRVRTPEQLDDQIEEAVRQARVRPSVPATTPAVSPPANGKATQFCPQCGRRVEPDDRFCPKCGRNLIQEPQSAQAARA